MAAIFHQFAINAPTSKVFEGITTPKGLDQWWTKSSDGKAGSGAIYTLDFGPGYIWQAVVTKYKADKEFELQMTKADADWLGIKIGFSLNQKGVMTEVGFYHTGWPENNEHYRVSCYCWAIYLRILKRYLEYGEEVLYERRLSV